MIQDAYIKQGDTGPLLTLILVDDKGNLITKALPAASSQYRFHMMTNDMATVIIANGQGQLINDTAKTVGYAWQAADTVLASEPDYPHLAEMQVTFDDGTIITFPNDGFLRVHITKQAA